MELHLTSRPLLAGLGLINPPLIPLTCSEAVCRPRLRTSIWPCWARAKWHCDTVELWRTLNRSDLRLNPCYLLSTFCLLSVSCSSDSWLLLLSGSTFTSDFVHRLDFDLCTDLGEGFPTEAVALDFFWKLIFDQEVRWVVILTWVSLYALVIITLQSHIWK